MFTKGMHIVALSVRTQTETKSMHVETRVMVTFGGGRLEADTGQGFVFSMLCFLILEKVRSV